MSSRKSKTASGKSKGWVPDYPLQGTELDVPLVVALSLSPTKRRTYIHHLIDALRKEVKSDQLSLKRRTSFAVEMRDLRRLMHAPADEYLFTDDRNRRRWVLGKGSPGSSHVYWSRRNIWKMETKIGSLEEDVLNGSRSLVRMIDRFLDPEITSKKSFRNPSKSAVLSVLEYLQFQMGSGCAFPPFHARFLADKYLPRDRDGIVVDPCAGWGGRLIGTLLVNRSHSVRYIGIDPEERNREAYEGLTRRATKWLKKEIRGSRDSTIYSVPFEDWIETAAARKLFGKVDLVMTSPPYFGAERYNPSNPNQSANRYDEYLAWREGFYRPLMKGAFKLLRPGGHFVLNIANVAEAPKLEKDARQLAGEEGLVSDGFFKLALSILPSARKTKNARHMVQVNGKLFKTEPVFVWVKPQSS